MSPAAGRGRRGRLPETLGTWTYVLVAALAFLETGAFVGREHRKRSQALR
jgi:hypothetical protein